MLFLQNRLGGSYIIKSLYSIEIFKAKFFPNCLIMEAKDSNSGSHAWKSILKGRDVLKKDAFWRVGNGRSIKLSDNWLPIPNHPKSLSLGATQFPNFQSVHKSLELRLGNFLFPSQEPSTMKGIPLSRFPTADILYWPHENHSTF